MQLVVIALKVKTYVETRFQSLAIDTSVDFTKAITSLPTPSSSSLTERVVITEVTTPEAVCTSICPAHDNAPLPAWPPWKRKCLTAYWRCLNYHRNPNLFPPYPRNCAGRFNPHDQSQNQGASP